MRPFVDLFSFFFRVTFSYALAAALLLLSQSLNAAESGVTLALAKRVVNVNGEATVAFTINESLNGTVLPFAEGDIATITVENGLDQAVSFYWQGLAQGSDATSFSTTMIPAMQRKTYAFALLKAGTYRFFAQQGFAQQRGLQGVVVVKPRSPRMIHFDHEAVLQFGEWHTQRSRAVWSKLKKDADWYAFSDEQWRGIVDYFKAREASTWLGRRRYGVDTALNRGAFGSTLLVNGERDIHTVRNARAGEVIRYRVVNHGTDALALGSNTDAMTVIAADGKDIEPVSIQELTVAAGELFDVLLTVPKSGVLRVAATSALSTNTARVTAGAPIKSSGSANQYGAAQLSSEVVQQWPLIKAKQPQWRERGGALHRTHIIHADQPLVLDNSPVVIHPTLSQGLLQPTLPVSARGNSKQLNVDIKGSIDQFRWAMAVDNNGEPIYEDDSVVLTLSNRTPLAQSVYVLGHRLSVVTEEGRYLVPKSVVTVPALSTRQFQFSAKSAGDWRIASTDHFKVAAGLQSHFHVVSKDAETAVATAINDAHPFYQHTMFTLGSRTAIASNTLSIDQHSVISRAELGAWDKLRATVDYRWLQGINTQWLLRAEHTDTGNSSGQHLLAGIRYTLPFSIESELAMTSEQRLRFMLVSKVQLSRHWVLSSALASDDQWRAQLNYQRRPEWSLVIRASDISPIGLGASLHF